MPEYDLDFERLSSDIGSASTGLTPNDMCAIISKIKCIERDKQVIIIRYDHDKMATYEEIGNKLGITKQRAWQIVQHQLRVMRRMINWEYANKP